MKPLQTYFFALLLVFCFVIFLLNFSQERPKEKDLKLELDPVLDVTSKTSLPKFEDTQDGRKLRISRVCEMCKHNRSTMDCNHVTLDTDFHGNYMYSNMLVDERHKVLYCMTPKAGCTTWKRVLAKSLVGNTKKYLHVHDFEKLREYGLNRLDTYSKRDIDKILKDYFKFIVVRDPFERLVSAYRDKFVRPNGVAPGFEFYTHYIKDSTNSVNVTFPNFVDYLLRVADLGDEYLNGLVSAKSSRYADRKTLKLISYGTEKRDSKLFLRKGSKYFNEHWAQYSTLCHPCHINYDYIVKFETMREDATFVLGKLGPHNLSLEHKYPELFSSTQTTAEIFMDFFATLSSHQIKQLRKIYSIDFKLFGYDS